MLAIPTTRIAVGATDGNPIRDKSNVLYTDPGPFGLKGSSVLSCVLGSVSPLSPDLESILPQVPDYSITLMTERGTILN